jgi:S-adenosylmethionine:tRNA ribosyltransferase-isomerase
MLRRDFDFTLPPELIAQQPLAERAASRLLSLDDGDGGLRDRRIADLPALLRPDDLLVVNDTRVLPARLFARKAGSGGQVEIFVERVQDGGGLLARVRASKPLRPGAVLEVEGGAQAEVLAVEQGACQLQWRGGVDSAAYLEAHGHMPLPPYIQRPDEATDRERYQTVFASAPGAIAAPTAGLHFDAALLAAIAARGVQLARVTLHVGWGTFEPVRSEHIEAHRLHAEQLEVPAATVQAVAATHARGGRVVAVGTTVVRALESAAQEGALRAVRGETTLFICPGYRFQVVDALLTNFHLPQSSLLMLVCAFGGQQAVLEAYRHAVTQRYRFFSYGDAMWLAPEGRSRQRRTHAMMPP